MSAPKTNAAWGFMGKVESTYGTPATLSGATDGILLEEAPEVDFNTYIYSGERGRSPAGAPMPRAQMSGLEANTKAVAAAIGAGAAYSASVTPNIHTLLRACGMEATVVTSPGTEKWTYASEIGPTGLDSVTLESYLAGEKYISAGTYGDFSIEADGPGVPKWTFNLKGLGTVVTDAAIPAITYPAISLQPPKAEAVGFTLGLFTAGIVRRFGFTQGREHDAQRLNINGSNTHAGFTPGGRGPILEVEIERVALATGTPWHTANTINPYKLKELGTQLICYLKVGSTQYNRWTITGGDGITKAQASIISVEKSFQGPTATWVIQIEMHASTYALQDDFVLIFD